jgi:ribonuclease E
VVDENVAQEEERVQVMPRRKQRQLSQRVRVGDTAEIAAVETPVVHEAPAETAPRAQYNEQPEASNDEQDDNENRDNANMPRRSRRSPRHLRVSGQRRRRYRDERYPTQSAMPLESAAASPEMASGKVWITYPVAPTYEQHSTQDAMHEVADYGYQQTADAVAQPATVAEIEPAVEQVAAAEAVHQAEPQAHVDVPVVNTDDVTPIAAPVNEEPSVISAADEQVAQETAAEAEPAAIVEEAKPAVNDVVEEIVEQAPADVSPAVEAQVEEVLAAPVAAVADIAPVTEPHAPVAARDVAVTTVETRFKHHATAPMTKAPAPEWQPEPVRHSDWVRPAFGFEGRGSAGGHSATHQATAPATRPESA